MPNIMDKPINRRRNGSRHEMFTLIELLVVVAILAILASILLPSLYNARQRALAIRCVSNLRGIGLAWSLYADDHAGRLSPAWVGTGVWWRDYYWGARLDTYMGIPDGTGHHQAQYVGTIAFCPADRGDPHHSRTYSGLSYLMNAFCGGSYDTSGLVQRLTQWPNSVHPIRTRMASIHDPSHFLVLGDQRENMARNDWDCRNPEPYIAVRHQGSANLLMADGHVEGFPSGSPALRETLFRPLLHDDSQ
ncbi:MAG: prepilin-type N-terminal cleavage/methylation domain-containing protein [Kiritimatiellales bacterium]|nr:prepilin-type N-terminal cleavage/methylation domain-containing protein [Kiritimatiellales bacterium]